MKGYSTDYLKTLEKNYSGVLADPAYQEATSRAKATTGASSFGLMLSRISEIRELLSTREKASCPIWAKAQSDDLMIQIGFDATEYIVNASIEELRGLKKCYWANDYQTDNVARHYRDTTTKSLFDYLDFLSDEKISGKDICGYECQVNEDLARNWLEINRPTDFASLYSEN